MDWTMFRSFFNEDGSLIGIRQKNMEKNVSETLGPNYMVFITAKDGSDVTMESLVVYICYVSGVKEHYGDYFMKCEETKYLIHYPPNHEIHTLKDPGYRILRDFLKHGNIASREIVEIVEVECE